MGCFTSKPETVEDKPAETEHPIVFPTKRAPEVKPKVPDIVKASYPKSKRVSFQCFSPNP